MNLSREEEALGLLVDERIRILRFVSNTSDCGYPVNRDSSSQMRELLSCFRSVGLVKVSDKPYKNLVPAYMYPTGCSWYKLTLKGRWLLFDINRGRYNSSLDLELRMRFGVFGMKQNQTSELEEYEK